ncbi:hypothetical protein MC885_012251, partial [Smutsia gigantea]
MCHTMDSRTQEPGLPECSVQGPSGSSNTPPPREELRFRGCAVGFVFCPLVPAEAQPWLETRKASLSSPGQLPSSSPVRESTGHSQSLRHKNDPLQDFGFSVDKCSKQLKSNINIRFGIILREDIKELFLDIGLFTKGSSILNFSYPVCEDDLPKFSFCGRRKG